LPFKVFSLTEIKKSFPQFDSKRLVEWQDKGYIKKLINKWYVFSDISITESFLYRISNCLHHPSYISLESAISHYHLIPEAVFSHQAISTRKTISYKTPLGTFNYRTLKPAFYFGYEIQLQEGFPILIAEMEKALLDYLYLNANMKTAEDLLGLRLNIQELQSSLNWEKLYKYAAIFNSASLNKRIKLLKKIILNAGIVTN
jgi:predicted transcriptional regulator of viral defense system